MKKEFITLGQIVNAHGIRGEVKFNPLPSIDPWFVAECEVLYIGGKPVEVKAARVHKSTVLLTLPGVNDMDAALALKGKEITLRRDDVELEEGDFFDEELIGCRVIDDATGDEIGTIRRVLSYPAHQVYEVRGAKEYLIPAVPDVFIASVDDDATEMRVHMMKGLATDEN